MQQSPCALAASRNTSESAPPAEELIGDMIARLSTRTPEIGHAMYVRVRDAVPDAATDDDLHYQAGIRSAIDAAIKCSLACIDLRLDLNTMPELPPTSAAQVRRAVRAGVGLGTLLRRCVAAHCALVAFISQDAESIGLTGHLSAMHHLKSALDALLERFTEAIEREYNDECSRAAESPHWHRFQAVKKLLSGTPANRSLIDTLDYRLSDSWHIGLVVTGKSGERFLHRMRGALHCQLLVVSPDDDALWAWLGTPKKLQASAVEESFATGARHDIYLAVGEPREGIAGWRLTHQDAQAASQIALRRPNLSTRSVNVPLEAAVLQADTPARLLLEAYLAPLYDRRSNGRSLRDTVGAYLAVGCNAATAAAKLGIDRHTVERHLRVAEARIGRPLRSCLPELAVALRLDELSNKHSPDCV
jgi:hypothetical protein